MRLTRIDIPFWDLVWLMIKVCIAMVPAGIILYTIGLAIGAVLGAIGLGAGALLTR